MLLGLQSNQKKTSGKAKKCRKTKNPKVSQECLGRRLSSEASFSFSMLFWSYSSFLSWVLDPETIIGYYDCKKAKTSNV